MLAKLPFVKGGGGVHSHLLIVFDGAAATAEAPAKIVASKAENFISKSD